MDEFNQENNDDLNSKSEITVNTKTKLQKYLCLRKNLNKSKLVLCIVTVIILLLVLGYFLSKILKNDDIDIHNFDTNKFENKYKFTSDIHNCHDMPKKKDLDTLLNAEKEMAKFLEHSKDKKKNNQVFLSYINVQDSFLANSIYCPKNFEKDFLHSNIKYKYISKGENSNVYRNYYEIIKPEIKSIQLYYRTKVLWYDTYSFEFVPSYFRDKYSEYLDSDFQKFFNILDKNQQEISSCVDESLVCSDILLRNNKAIFRLQNLNKEYPNSLLKGGIQYQIKTKVLYLLRNEYAFDKNTNKLTFELYNAYVDFLKNADKMTKEYKVVQEAFNILENNNFYHDTDFDICVNNYVDSNY